MARKPDTIEEVRKKLQETRAELAQVRQELQTSREMRMNLASEVSEATQMIAQLEQDKAELAQNNDTLRADHSLIYNEVTRHKTQIYFLRIALRDAITDLER